MIFWRFLHCHGDQVNKTKLSLVVADGHTQAIREQSGLVTETANAKVAAGVLEAKSRTAEVEVGG